MQRALQLALEESCAQTAVFATMTPEIVEMIKRALAAERN